VKKTQGYIVDGGAGFLEE